MTTVADVVGRTLATLGVGHAFGVVGSGNFRVTNALRFAGVPFTATRHEAGAATMADAYARMSGSVALVSVHQGCGLTNAATGICEAAKSRTPMIVLAAEATGATSNFAMDQAGFASSVGAVAERVHSGPSAVADTVRAWRTARDDRRTVVLNLPLDVQALEAEADPAVTVASSPGPAASSEVAELVALFAASRRPVIVAGRGARHAGPALRRLGEVTGALLATSAVANGLFHGDPYALGISGGFASPTAARLISEADLIVGFGCALNMWTMRHGRLIGADAKVAQVDVDEAVLGLHRPVHLGVVGDSAAVAEAVIAGLGGARPGYRTPEVADEIATRARWNDEPIDDLSTEDRIDPRVLSRDLDKLLPADRIVSIDSGNFMGYPSAYLGVPDEYGFCFTQAFQSIGLGLSTAIGAALARPDRLPVLAAGDGGFLMSIAELETAVRLNLPLLCVIYNDAAYGAEVHHFGADADLDTVVFPDTDIAALAQGFGAQGLTVRRPTDLRGITSWLESNPTDPLVVDAKIVSDGGSWWLAEAFKGH